jgi:thiamine pyrophosphate-dependent acetolactate synthase large subunit-like protein
VSFCVVDHTQMLTNKEGLQARRLIIFHENTMLADWRFTPAGSVIGHLEESTRSVAQLVKTMRGVAPLLLPPSACESCPRNYKVAPTAQGTAGYCHPGVFLNALSVALPPKAVVCVDVGDVTLWAAMAMCLTQPGQRVLSSEHMGIMG